MIRCDCGDVVLVDVVFSDGSGIKKRPAMVISSEEYNKNRREVIIAAITSNIKRVLPGDIRINQWEGSGLLFPSLVTGVIQTVKTVMITRKLGVLQKADLQKVRKSLGKAFGIYQ